jgi:hypothetical protein
MRDLLTALSATALMLVYIYTAWEFRLLEAVWRAM